MKREKGPNELYLEEYARLNKLDVPRKVRRFAQAADKLGAATSMYLNQESTEGRGCVVASSVRRVPSQTNTPLPSEGKATIWEFQGLDEDVFYVMSMTRGNRVTDMKEIIQALGGRTNGTYRRAPPKILERLGIRSGEILPLSVLAADDAELASKFIYVICSDLKRRYRQGEIVTTNALDREWGCGLDMPQFIERLKERCPGRVIDDQVIALGGPSDVLASLDRFLQRDIAIIANADATFEGQLHRCIEDKVLGLRETDYSSSNGVIRKSPLPVQYEGAMSAPVMNIFPVPSLDFSISSDYLHFTRTMDALATVLKKVKSSGADTLVVNCNNMSGLVEAIYAEGDNVVKKNLEERGVDLGHIRNITYIPKRDAVMQYLAAGEDQDLLLIAGVEASKGERSIYHQNDWPKDVRLHTLRTNSTDSEAHLITRAMDRAKRRDYVEAQAYIARALAGRDLGRYSGLVIGSTTLCRMVEEQGGLLDIRHSTEGRGDHPVLEKLKEHGAEMDPEKYHELEGALMRRPQRDPYVNTSHLYAKFVIDQCCTHAPS